MAAHPAGDSLVKPQLEYPVGQLPARGKTLEVAPGVHWIRMPLPYALDHINLWALDDGAGWAIVDTGVRNDETVKVWRELFANATGERPISRVFVTHMHPDHVGLAGWLTRRPGVKLWMTRLEYLTCRVMMSDSGRHAPQDAVEFYRNVGWSDGTLESYRVRFGNFGNQIHTLPDSYQRLVDGQEIRIGKHTWRVVVGSGHSPEHACLYCPDLKLFVSGDQVLPRISSNVSVYATNPDANPMSEWYASIDKIKKEIPDDVLVLPAHNECFRGLHARLDYLKASQDHALERLLHRLNAPRRAIDVFEALFGRQILDSEMPNFGLATGEAIACLNYLQSLARVERTQGEDGVIWYKATKETN